MASSNEFETISEVNVLLEDCSARENIICYCTRVWCDDYHDYSKGTKGLVIEDGTTDDDENFEDTVETLDELTGEFKDIQLEEKCQQNKAAGFGIPSGDIKKEAAQAEVPKPVKKSDQIIARMLRITKRVTILQH